MKVLVRINFLWNIYKTEFNKYAADGNTIGRTQNWLWYSDDVPELNNNNALNTDIHYNFIIHCKVIYFNYLS